MSVQLVATCLPASLAATADALLHPPPGADWLELRLDGLPERTPEAVAALLARPRSIQVLAACRACGADELGDDARLGLLAAAARAGAELVDVDDKLLARLPADLPGERVASCHIDRFVPRLDALARRLLATGARFAKLAVPADTPKQLAELLALQEALEAETPGRFALVTTGRLAEAGRVAAAGRGAALAYGALDALAPGHPDQPTLARLHAIHAVGAVGPATRFYGIVAHPAGHSLSPAFHNTVFRRIGQDARLVPLDVERLADVLEQADALRLDGLAVSHPFKADALALAQSRMPGALAARAANTLLRTPTGWQARNTDWKAACDLLPKLLRKWRAAHPERTPRVLLLGSGGAARAVAVALYDEEVELAVWSRRFSNARAFVAELADALPALAVPDPGHAPSDLVIHATPVGGRGVDPGELPVTPGIFRADALAVDLVYGEGPSPFREAAALAGAQLTRGEEFFLRQARRQSELFTNGSISAEAYHEAAECVAAPV